VYLGRQQKYAIRLVTNDFMYEAMHFGARLHAVIKILNVTLANKIKKGKETMSIK